MRRGEGQGLVGLRLHLGASVSDMQRYFVSYAASTPQKLFLFDICFNKGEYLSNRLFMQLDWRNWSWEGIGFAVTRCVLAFRETRNSVDTLFIVLMASIVFLMHAGFGMVCTEIQLTLWKLFRY